MIINSAKSGCIRFGPRFDKPCLNIVTSCGKSIPWVCELRYLGVYFVSSTKFRCSLSYAKRAFCRAANVIIGRVGLHNTEAVILSLFATKCMPILLHGIGVCDLTKGCISSLDFTASRFLMKLFRTNNRAVIQECISYFDFKLPGTCLISRFNKFKIKYNNCVNEMCIRISTY